MSVKEEEKGSTVGSHVPGTRRGEEVKREDGQEPGRYEKEEEGTNRPTGGSTARDATGVNPKDPVEPKSPKLIPG